ncbi:hypothetical protein [Lachnoclostridium phytofermentans]|uniref:hypothetical protein n=1 Tax=Lachnoclostridium phytofermentans TaxID=66219 RepID=UPI00049656F8|nr:hypothetical protein [Lachnoclostridium phytofermentans]
MLHLFEKIWQNRIAKIILFVLSGFILLIFAIWYLSLFNQKVMNFNGDSLKQIELSDSTQYQGKYLNESILINVQKSKQNTGEIIVEYNLPNKLYFKYNVLIETIDNFRGKIKIFQDNKELFNGIYDNKQTFYLYINNSEPYLRDMLSVVVSNNHYPDNYTPPLSSIARFATGHGVEKRGEIIPLIMFFIVLAIYLVDIKYPQFFFLLQNLISVKDPEPSEFYLAMQKLGWFVIYPILLVVLLFKGVC